MDTSTIENLSHEWSPQAPSQSRRLKVILPQFYAALAIFAVNLSNEIFQPMMYLVANSMHIETTALLSNSIFSVGFSVITCIGLLVGGIVAQITGARVIVMLAGAVSIVGWIIFGWVSSVTILQWTFYIVIFTKAMMQTPSYVYLAEISQPNMRNPLMAAMCVATNIGSIYMYLNITDSIKVSAILGVVFALVGLIVMFFLPDSPYWLANKGRYGGVESSLAWFRGQTTVENVKAESKSIINNAQISPIAYKLFCQRSFYIVALVVGYVFLATAFVRIFFTTYFPNITAIMKYLGYHGEMSRIFQLFGIYTILISVFFVSLVTVVGKRIIILVSLFGGSMALVVASITGYLSENEILSTYAYWWFFLICLAVVYLSLIVGVVPVPLLLNGEIFPSKLRNLGAGFGLFFVQIVQLVSNLIYIEYFLSSHGAVLTLALISMFGFIPLLWLFPRNEIKSLVEIEHTATSISELRRKK